MELANEIQSALKEKKVVVGYKKSLEFIKNGSPKMIVISQNIPDRERREVEHDARVSGAKVETFEGNSKDLGIVCGKPFPIMLLVVKE